MLCCERFEGGKVEDFEGAQFFIMAVDGCVVCEVEDELEAVIEEQGLLQRIIKNDFVGGNRRSFVFRK